MHNVYSRKNGINLNSGNKRNVLSISFDSRHKKMLSKSLIIPLMNSNISDALPSFMSYKSNALCMNKI